MTPAEEERLSRLGESTGAHASLLPDPGSNDLTVRVLRRLRDNPDMGDPGPRPIEWPADHPLPPILTSNGW